MVREAQQIASKSLCVGDEAANITQTNYQKCNSLEIDVNIKGILSVGKIVACTKKEEDGKSNFW